LLQHKHNQKQNNKNKKQQKGSSHLRLIGWPVERMASDFSDSQLRKFAGESFSVPVSTVVAVASILNPHAPWHAR
jgi:hypothetical protein